MAGLSRNREEYSVKKLDELGSLDKSEDGRRRMIGLGGDHGPSAGAWLAGICWARPCNVQACRGLGPWCCSVLPATGDPRLGRYRLTISDFHSTHRGHEDR